MLIFLVIPICLSVQIVVKFKLSIKGNPIGYCGLQN